MRMRVFVLFVLLISFGSAATTITDSLITTTGNASATYFIGDGSLLTGITNDNSSWNESYARDLFLENGTNIELGINNITTTGTGFFKWLGSLANRITSLFVVNINAVNYTLNGTTISSWDEVNGSTDTQKNASGYLYNDTTTIYLNETKLNDTINATLIPRTMYPMGEISTQANTIVTALDIGVWKLINATWVGNDDNMNFQNYSNGTLMYTGTETMFFHIANTLSMKSGSPNDNIHASIYKNGVILPASEISQDLGGSGEVASTAIHVATLLSEGDYLNVYVKNNDGPEDVTITYANFFAMGMHTS